MTLKTITYPFILQLISHYCVCYKLVICPRLLLHLKNKSLHIRGLIYLPALAISQVTDTSKYGIKIAYTSDGQKVPIGKFTIFGSCI